MKTLTIIVLVVQVFSLGCSHVYTVNATDPRQMAGPNRLCRGRITRVVLKDSHAFGARDLFMTPDSTSWLDTMTGRGLTVDTPRIAYLRVRCRGLEAGKGLLAGLVVGALVGAAIGFAGGDDPPAEALFDWRMSASAKATLGALLGGGLGGLAGLIAGARQESVITYEMVP